MLSLVEGPSNDFPSFPQGHPLGQSMQKSNSWLVVLNMAFIFPNSWDDDPI